jgi:hypothetical protein
MKRLLRFHPGTTFQQVLPQSVSGRILERRLSLALGPDLLPTPLVARLLSPASPISRSCCCSPSPSCASLEIMAFLPVETLFAASPVP